MLKLYGIYSSDMGILTSYYTLRFNYPRKKFENRKYFRPVSANTIKFFKSKTNNFWLAQMWAEVGRFAVWDKKPRKIWESFFLKSLKVDVMGGALQYWTCALIQEGDMEAILKLHKFALKQSLQQPNHDSFTQSYILYRMGIYAAQAKHEQLLIRALKLISEDYFNPWFLTLIVPCYVYINGEKILPVRYLTKVVKKGVFGPAVENDSFLPQILRQKNQPVQPLYEMLNQVKRELDITIDKRRVQNRIKLLKEYEGCTAEFVQGHEFCGILACFAR